jgi:hypothetical protein
MSFSNVVVADELVAVLAGLSGMGVAQVGAPESFGPKVGSYVTLGGIQSQRVVSAVVERDTRFFCMFAYRVDEAEATAETTLMGLVDGFMDALNADLTLGGVARSLEISSSTADEPEYQLRAGREYREYPVVVTVKQRDSYAVNP